MKTITFLIFFSVFIALGGFSQADTNTDKSNKENDKMDDSSQSGRKLIESGIYEFKPTMALPMTGTSVSITSGQYFLRIEGDLAESALPFFGEAYRADFSGEGGIVFTVKMKDYKLVNNEKKNRYQISFKISDGKDHYDIFMDAGYDGLSSVRIGSLNKSQMSYYGYLRKISKPEKKKFEK